MKLKAGVGPKLSFPSGARQVWNQHLESGQVETWSNSSKMSHVIWLNWVNCLKKGLQNTRGKSVLRVMNSSGWFLLPEPASAPPSLGPGPGCSLPSQERLWKQHQANLTFDPWATKYSWGCKDTLARMPATGAHSQTIGGS